MHRRAFLSSMSLFWFATPEPPAADTWVSRAAMPIARSETPAIAHNGLIYVAGGFGAGDRADAYDPETDTWRQLADLPTPTNHPGIACFQDMVIVAGGYSMDGAHAHDGIWAYASERDGWEQIGVLPAQMGAFGLVTLRDTVYLVGGALQSLNGDPSPATWSWSPSDNRWEERAPLSHAREHMATVAAGESIFAIGGRAHGQDSDELGSMVERYDPDADTWQRLDPLPYPRSGLNGAALCNNVVVAGGETSTEVFATAQMLNTASGTWSELPNLPAAVHGVAVAAFDRQIFAIGGSTAAGRIQNIAAVSMLEMTRATGACDT